MKIWLITIGEPLPTDGPNERLLRTGMLASVLGARGHDVTWWSSSWDHQRKKQRFDADATVTIAPNVQLDVLHAPGYTKNVSLRRIANHRRLARRFRQVAASRPRPDVIVCSLPPIELCVAATDYGHAHGVPVVLDARDLWPDIYLDVVPRALQPLGRLALQPFVRMTRRACARAAALIGITSGFVAWALRYAGRPATDLDRAFPLGYTETRPDAAHLDAALALWDKLGVRGKEHEFTVCFFAALGRHLDIGPVLAAAEALRGENVRFVLCGNFDPQQRVVAGPNVTLPGWVGSAEIWSLMRRSSAGIVAYRDRPDFQVSLPNKSIEYLSAGLPVISSLSGTLAELLAARDCGVTYHSEEELVRNIRELSADPARLARMSANALALYQETFVAERIYSAMSDYLEDVASRTRGRRNDDDRRIA